MKILDGSDRAKQPGEIEINTPGKSGEISFILLNGVCIAVPISKSMTTLIIDNTNGFVTLLFGTGEEKQ